MHDKRSNSSKVFSIKTVNLYTNTSTKYLQKTLAAVRKCSKE